MEKSELNSKAYTYMSYTLHMHTVHDDGVTTMYYVYKCILIFIHVSCFCTCIHRSCKNTLQWTITLSLANVIIEFLLTTHRVLFAVSNYNVECCLTTSQRRTTNMINSSLGLFLFGVQRSNKSVTMLFYAGKP